MSELVMKVESESDWEGGLVLVDFWASWCGPCKLMEKELNEAAELLKEEVKIMKVDVDKHQRLASKYDVLGVPTLILFKESEIVARSSGYMSKETVLEFVSKFK